MRVTLHILLAISEFFLVNWMGKHTLSSGYYQISFIQTVEDSPLFNVVFRILAPTVFLVITAAVWYALGLDAVIRQYWHVTVLYFAVRWGFNLLMGRSKLLNWGKQVVIAGFAIALSVLVSEQLLVHREAVLPSSRGLTDELWIVVIGFIYVTVNRVSWPHLGTSGAERKNQYLRSRYLDFRRRFGAVIVGVASSKACEALSYAVMIYESFNRPRVYQLIENWILFPVGMARTLGPMQVSSPSRLPQAELVRLGVERVNEALSGAFARMREDSPGALTVHLRRDPNAGYETPLTEDIDLSTIRFEDVGPYYQTEIVRGAVTTYNIRSDYPDEVAGIFEFIRETFYPDLNPDNASAHPVAAS